MTVAKSQSLPKSLQVSELLIREIAAGLIPDGAKLPPEREMAGELGVAVGTLRSALAILEDKGLLKRVHGSGNYVNAKPDVNSVYTFFRLELLEGGGLPTAKVLEVLRLKKDPAMPEIGPGDLGHRIRRIRYLNDIPIALEEIWLDGRFVDWISYESLRESLYYYYKTKLHLIIGSVIDQIGGDKLPSWVPDDFGLEAGSQCGFIQRRSFSINGQAAEFSRSWYNHNICHYTNRMGK